MALLFYVANTVPIILHSKGSIFLLLIRFFFFVKTTNSEEDKVRRNCDYAGTSENLCVNLILVLCIIYCITVCCKILLYAKLEINGGFHRRWKFIQVGNTTNIYKKPKNKNNLKLKFIFFFVHVMSFIVTSTKG